MSGKSMALIFLLTGSLVMSACSKAASPQIDQTNGEYLASPDVNNPTDTPSLGGLQPVEYKQKVESLPAAESLTTFPGVLESMSMTLEQLITVLGTRFDLKENKAQHYDTYSFPQYDLAFDFDRVSKEITTIWLNRNPYYVSSGVFKTEDFNSDGNLEKIAAYEDGQHNGHVLVMDGAKSTFSDVRLDFFGGQCNIEVLSQFGSDKENLLLVKTHGGNNGDVIEWKNGELKSLLPGDYRELLENNMVTVEGDKAVMLNEDRNLLYICPLPKRVLKNTNDRSNNGVHRFDIMLTPEKSGDSIILKARTSLQVIISDNYNFIDSTDGTYCDVAQMTQEYKYLGQGKWQEQRINGGPKYENSESPGILAEDLSISGLTLYDNVDSLKGFGELDPSSYTSLELREGIIMEVNGLCIGITQEKISYLSLENGSQKSTSKGLKLGDSRERAHSLYGLPDKGYMEDSNWTYYILSEEKSEYNLSVLVNTLNIEFDDDKVCRIWISAYVMAT